MKTARGLYNLKTALVREALALKDYTTIILTVKFWLNHRSVQGDSPSSQMLEK